jgi:hypothetical protein
MVLRSSEPRRIYSLLGGRNGSGVAIVATCRLTSVVFALHLVCDVAVIVLARRLGYVSVNRHSDRVDLEGQRFDNA